MLEKRCRLGVLKQTKLHRSSRWIATDPRLDTNSGRFLADVSSSTSSDNFLENHQLLCRNWQQVGKRQKTQRKRSRARFEAAKMVKSYLIGQSNCLLLWSNCSYFSVVWFAPSHKSKMLKNRADVCLPELQTGRKQL